MVQNLNMKKNSISRFPRGLGVTDMAQKANSGDDNSLISLTNYAIHSWIVSNGNLWGRTYSQLELAKFLNCDPTIIQTRMRDLLLNNGLFDRSKSEQIADSIAGACIGWALEDRMEISQQVNILKEAQGTSYAPFISGELNKAIGLKQQTTSALQSLLRSLTGGANINIFHQQNNQFNSVSENITREMAMEMIQKELADRGETVKELEYVENKYDFKELPEVVAVKQDGNRSDKEGITLKNHEIEAITGDYHGALKAFDEDHHAIRREIEENIDYEEIDPEII